MLFRHLLTSLRLPFLQEEVRVQEKMTPERSGCAVPLRNVWRTGRYSGFDEAESQLKDGMVICCKRYVQ